MNKQIKRLLACVLIVSLSIISLMTVSAAKAFSGTVAPFYNNVGSATSAISINDSGKLTIGYKYSGYSSITTKAVITTYIEKKTLGLFWKRVDIGKTNNEWIDTINDYRYTGSRTHQLSSSGTYRVTVIYNIYGSGGSADEITCQATDSY